MKLAEKLKALAGDRRGVRSELAREVRVDSGRVSRWMEGKLRPSQRHLLLIARFFDVPLEYLVDESITEVPQRNGPTDDERVVLRVFRALNIDSDEAIRRLMGEEKPRMVGKGRAEVEAERQKRAGDVR